ncbi:MAG: bifunctional glutamate N-acetyltransferase/amino-acid acetyltransferase ArgJ [Clostridia bacterium]|nr:bifunctional glutamate N-acetyltransferase/amino-acid acetyltransferase ArgJ [Clostridia bacterium]
MGFEIIAGGVTAVPGFQASGVHVGIKQTNKTKKDIALIYSKVPAVAAGVFTTNKVQAAPVLISKEHLQGGQVQAVVANSGNANACTGEQGLGDARAMAHAAAFALGLEPEQVLVASTGVIGVPMPMEVVLPGIKQAAEALSEKGGQAAAEAIMTTDTFAKEIAVRVNLGGTQVTIGAIAKGSGMIHPNMATMLAFVTTDAVIDRLALQEAVKKATEKSFNMITVDGDTSTNDMLVVLANGIAGNSPVSLESPELTAFSEALDYVCIEMAKAIARDGEGATKLVEVRVQGAKTGDDAKKAALAVAKSSLVKTAIYGSDANWGRILAAVGYSGADFDPAAIDLYLQDQLGEITERMMAKGAPLAFNEEKARMILDRNYIIIIVELNQGPAQATAWGCDLTYDYVKINADYRT